VLLILEPEGTITSRIRVEWRQWTVGKTIDSRLWDSEWGHFSSGRRSLSDFPHPPDWLVGWPPYGQNGVAMPSPPPAPLGGVVSAAASHVFFHSFFCRGIGQVHLPTATSERTTPGREKASDVKLCSSASESIPGLEINPPDCTTALRPSLGRRSLRHIESGRREQRWSGVETWA